MASPRTSRSSLLLLLRCLSAPRPQIITPPANPCTLIQSSQFSFISPALSFFTPSSPFLPPTSPAQESTPSSGIYPFPLSFTLSRYCQTGVLTQSRSSLQTESNILSPQTQSLTSYHPSSPAGAAYLSSAEVTLNSPSLPTEAGKPGLRCDFAYAPGKLWQEEYAAVKEHERFHGKRIKYLELGHEISFCRSFSSTTWSASVENDRPMVTPALSQSLNSSSSSLSDCKSFGERTATVKTSALYSSRSQTGWAERAEEKTETGGNLHSEHLIGSSYAYITKHKSLKNAEIKEGEVKNDAAVDVSVTGWTRQEVLNWPNGISMARLISGPVLAWIILQGFPHIAFGGMLIAGISDWLDGYVARRMGVKSILGSYLDPLADKVLVGSVALSMAYAGLLHPALVALVVARDGALVTGVLLHRAHSLSWKWMGWGDFFCISSGRASKVEPLYISKVNTVLQLAVICAALLQPTIGNIGPDLLVSFLSWSVVGTTTASWLGYAWVYVLKPVSRKLSLRG